jgi:AcrR family transcriptional regulator
MPTAALKKARESPSSTKARILAAAEEVFASKGFEGASTRDIAAAAAVNISSLHYHWESKETLYYAVFEDVYDRLVDIVRSSSPESTVGPPASRSVIDDAVGQLFDFFADHPNVPKLLVRRLLEADSNTSEIEQEILLPAWRHFALWTSRDGHSQLSEIEAQMFMLSVQSVMLLYMLDSQQFVALLGSSIRSPELRSRLRDHMMRLVHSLLPAK